MNSVKHGAGTAPTARRRGETMEIQIGFDTFCFYHSLSPRQKRAIMKELKARSKFKPIRDDYENNSYEYASSYFAKQGVNLRISRIKGSVWGLYIIVHPTLVLGDDDRSALYQVMKSSYIKIVKTVDKMLKPIHIPCSLDDMLLYRLDITVNLIFDSEYLVAEYIRIMKKSIIMPRYKVDRFREEEKKARDCKAANENSHKQYCKSAAFFIYNKTAQLKMIDRFPGTLIGKEVLRFEAQLRRKALKKWMPNEEFGDNWQIIRDTYKKREKIINWYLKRIQPVGKYVRYKDAVDLVKNIKFKKKVRERMLYLLRKASDKDSLTAALDDLKKKHHLTSSQCKTVLKKFQKLGISPITLRNSSDLDELPSIHI